MQAEKPPRRKQRPTKQARPERHEDNDDQIKKGDRAGLEAEPEGGKGDQCQADDAKRKCLANLTVEFQNVTLIGSASALKLTRHN